jgi:hypothetical protein
MAVYDTRTRYAYHSSGKSYSYLYMQSSALLRDRSFEKIFLPIRDSLVRDNEICS